MAAFHVDAMDLAEGGKGNANGKASDKAKAGQGGFRMEFMNRNTLVLAVEKFANMDPDDAHALWNQISTDAETRNQKHGYF